MNPQFQSGLFLSLTLLAAIVSVASCSTQHEAVDPAAIVPVIKVTRADLSNEMVLTAEFIPYQDVDVMAKVAGYVRDIRVDMGDHVHQGELLATLEDPELQNEMIKATVAARAAQSDVTTAQNNLAQAKAAYEIARLSYTRIEDVSQKEPGLVPQQDVDVAHSHDLESEAQQSAAQSSLQSAEERCSEAIAEEQRLKTLYQYTSITAPFTGVVTKRYADVGSMIQAGIASQTQSMPIVRIAQNDLLRLILPVPVAAVPQIHIGQEVDVNVTTLKKTFPGRVTRFADTIQMSTRTMNTEVDVPNPNYAIVPGMYAEVHLHLQDRRNTLSVPLDAVEGLGGDKQTAYLVDRAHTIHIVPVTTGVETPNRVEILSGIHDGDLLIVGEHTGMKSGETVQPQIASFDAGTANDTGN